MTVRLLIIEDDPEIAALLKRYLTRKGFDLVLETNGEAGVNRFRQDEFHVILCDGLLPKGNGFFVSKEIRASPGGQNVGLVMMSAAYRSTGARREASEAGFDAYFAKPFAVSELAQKLAELALKYTGVKLIPQSQRPLQRKAINPNAPDGGSRRGKRRRSAATPPPPAVPAKRQMETGVPEMSHDARARSRGLDAAAIGSASDSLANQRRARSASHPQKTNIRDHTQTIRILLELARSMFDGSLVLRDNDIEMEIVWRRGIPISATDNLRETTIGERMCRLGVLQYSQLMKIQERIKGENERFAEAGLALGFFNEDLAMAQIAEQFEERLQRAVAWHRGSVETVPEIDLGSGGVPFGANLLHSILSHFLLAPETSTAQAMLKPMQSQYPQPTRDFEPGLVAFANLRPRSTAPGYLMSGQSKLENIVTDLGQEAFNEILALWRAGMICFDGEVAPRSPIAMPLSEDNLSEGDVDLDAAKKVQRHYLKNWGRSYYDLLQISDRSTKDKIRRAILDARARFGGKELEGKELGQTKIAARKLWIMLEQAERTLLNDGLRKKYDAKNNKKVHNKVQFEVEENYLQGRLFLAEKKYSKARDAFETAVIKRPSDVDALAFLGWTTILLAKLPKERGMALLDAAAALNPQAVRPYYFLGLAAYRDNEIDKANQLLVQAVRRCPGDEEMMSALAVVEGKTKITSE